MEIVPVRQEYIFKVSTHSMRAVAEHIENARKLSYYFDDKLVVEKAVPGGEYYTDDECISEAIDNYKKSKKDVYADLLNRHLDKISLSAKIIDAKLINYGIVTNARVKIIKDYYEIELTTGENVITGKFKSENFSEVLEKMRLFTSMLEGVSADLTEKINLLSNDKIEAVIKWQE